MTNLENIGLIIAYLAFPILTLGLIFRIFPSTRMGHWDVHEYGLCSLLILFWPLLFFCAIVGGILFGIGQLVQLIGGKAEKFSSNPDSF